MDSRSSWISFIVIAVAIAIVSPRSCGAADLIYDTDGHVLQQGVQYCVLPATKTKGHGGGLSLAKRNNTCPLYVAQRKSETSQGIPVVFTPLESGDAFQDGISVHIRSAAKTVCAQSNIWKVNGSFIEASSATGSHFNIGKEGDNDYVLSWCPGGSWCKKCGHGPVVFCQKLGIYVDKEENRWVALPSLASETLNVQFKNCSAIQF